MYMYLSLIFPWRCGCDFECLIFKYILVTDIISIGTVLRWMPQNNTDDKSTLVLVMAWCRQATSHYLNQCLQRPMTPYDITRPHWQWAKLHFLVTFFTSHFIHSRSSSVYVMAWHPLDPKSFSAVIMIMITMLHVSITYQSIMLPSKAQIHFTNYFFSNDSNWMQITRCCHSQRSHQFTPIHSHSVHIKTCHGGCNILWRQLHFNLN